MDKIYLVTTVHIGDQPTHKDKSLIKRKRTVGWFTSFEDAVWIIVNNKGDIHEAGHYDHCVIEEMPSGLYPFRNWEKWFKWGSKYEQYLPVDRPEGLEDSLCNIG